MITEGLRLKWDLCWSAAPANTCAQAGPSRASCTGPHQDGFWMSPRTETPQPPWATCASVWKAEIHLLWELSISAFYLLPCHWGLLTRAWLPLLNFLQPAFTHTDKAPLSLAFSTLSGPSSLRFPHMKDVPVPGPPLCTSTEFVPVYPCFSHTGETRTESSTSGMASPVLRRGFTSINLLATILLMQPRRLLANSLRWPIKTSVSINQGVKAKSLTHFQKLQQLDYKQKDICRVTVWWAVLLRLAKYPPNTPQQNTVCYNRIKDVRLIVYRKFTCI